MRKLSDFLLRKKRSNADILEPSFSYDLLLGFHKSEGQSYTQYVQRGVDLGIRLIRSDFELNVWIGGSNWSASAALRGWLPSHCWVCTCMFICRWVMVCVSSCDEMWNLASVLSLIWFCIQLRLLGVLFNCLCSCCYLLNCFAIDCLVYVNKIYANELHFQICSLIWISCIKGSVPANEKHTWMLSFSSLVFTKPLIFDWFLFHPL